MIWHYWIHFVFGSILSKWGVSWSYCFLISCRIIFPFKNNNNLTNKIITISFYYMKRNNSRINFVRFKILSLSNSFTYLKLRLCFNNMWRTFLTRFFICGNIIFLILRDKVFKEFQISWFNNYIRLQTQKSICFIVCIAYKNTFDLLKTQLSPFRIHVLIISYTSSHSKINDIWCSVFPTSYGEILVFSKKSYSLYDKQISKFHPINYMKIQNTLTTFIISWHILFFLSTKPFYYSVQSVKQSCIILYLLQYASNLVEKYSSLLSLIRTLILLPLFLYNCRFWVKNLFLFICRFQSSR